MAPIANLPVREFMSQRRTRTMVEDQVYMQNDVLTEDGDQFFSKGIEQGGERSILLRQIVPHLRSVGAAVDVTP